MKPAPQALLPCLVMIALVGLQFGQGARRRRRRPRSAR